MTEQSNLSQRTVITNQSQVVEAAQKLMSHAWMVRTFIKHSDEIEDFPELMHIVRAVFDTSRALETCIENPPKYIRMMQKKLPKLKQAAAQFKLDAEAASTHTNFQQAVISIATVIEELQTLLDIALQIPADDGNSTPVGQ